MATDMHVAALMYGADDVVMDQTSNSVVDV